VPTMTGYDFITARDIIRFEANGNYTTIYMEGREKILTTRSISEYEGVLPGALFCRIHNSHIINLEKIAKYNKGRGGCVISEDGANIQVATRLREEFLNRLTK